jgi:aspartate aminotransferase
MKLKSQGFSVDAIAPEAAIYLTIKIDLAGKTTEDGTLLADQSDVTAYLLNEASLAVVPFYALAPVVILHGTGLALVPAKKKRSQK